MTEFAMRGEIVDRRVPTDHGQLVFYESGAVEVQREGTSSEYLNSNEVRLLVEAFTTEGEYEQVYRHMTDADTNESD